MSAQHWLTGLVLAGTAVCSAYHLWGKPHELTYESCKDRAVFETPHGKLEIKYLNGSVRTTIDQIILEREAPGKPLSPQELYQLHKRLDANSDNVITPEETQHYQNSLPKQ